MINSFTFAPVHFHHEATLLLLGKSCLPWLQLCQPTKLFWFENMLTLIGNTPNLMKIICLILEMPLIPIYHKAWGANHLLGYLHEHEMSVSEQNILSLNTCSLSSAGCDKTLRNCCQLGKGFKNLVVFSWLKIQMCTICIILFIY